jgi:hypothetical protein
MTTSNRPTGALTLIALAILSTGSVAIAADTRLSLELPEAHLHTDLGEGNSIFFTRPQPQTGSTLITRPANGVLCSSPVQTASAEQGATVDPNGFLPPFAIGGRAPHQDLGLLSISSFPANAQFRTAQRIGFGDMLFPVEPNFVVVSDVQATCVQALAQPTPSTAPLCEVMVDSFTADRISNQGFEPSGQLQLHSRVIDYTPTGIYYEHVVVASGGQVSGAQLREQFPYHTSAPGQSRFKDSLNIDSSWVCRASAGAQCSPYGISDAGMGYAHIDGASLDAGSCLRIVAMRPIAREGALDNDFSGSLHAALFHASPSGNGGVATDVAQTRLNFD